MTRRQWLGSLALAALSASPGLCADLCSEILRYGIFEKHEQIDERYLVRQVQHIFCSSSYSKSDAEKSLGLDLSAVVEAIPIQVGGVYQDREQKEWREEACKYDWSSLRDWSSRKISITRASETVVGAWSKCMEKAKDGIVAGISSTTMTDFDLTIQVSGLDAVDRLKYNRAGIRVSPEGAAQFVPADEFARIKSLESRKHVFRMRRSDPERGFRLLIGSKPMAVELDVPPVSPPVTKKTEAFKTTFLNKLTPSRIDGIYSTTMCAGTNGFAFANGQTYPDSLYMHPGVDGFTTVEWMVPLGAKKLVIEGVGFCQDRKDSPACFDTNSGFPHSSWSVTIDGFKPADGAGEIGWSHADGRSVDARPRTYDVAERERVVLQTGHINGRYCDHTTFLNPRFEP